MPSRAPFGLETLREAVRARVEETSIRAVAEEIGMSSSGLHVLLQGTKPHPATRAKLVAWYVTRDRAGKASISDADADVAVRLLVRYLRGLTSAHKQRRRREIIDALAHEEG